ncbi:MAG: TetR/AcrR family transcriptional regulator [Geminicoccaceae bacterium]
MKVKAIRAQSVEARRKLIVESAIMCFVEKGFHQTSIRDIAKRAGISLGNVYNHFENKSALIAEIATYEADQIDGIEQELLKNTDPTKALDRFVSLYTRQCSEPGVPLLIAEVVSEGLRNPEIGSGFMKNRSRLVSSIAVLVERLIERDDLAADISYSDYAEFILNLIEGLTMRCAIEGKNPRARDVAVLKKGIRRLVGV